VYFLCFVDDGGQKPHWTFTGLLIPVGKQRDLLALWNAARRRLASQWGVPTELEIKANQLITTRGRLSGATHLTPMVSLADRLEAYEIMLEAVAACEWIRATVTCRFDRGREPVSGHSGRDLAYLAFIEHLADWAAREQSSVVIVYDGGPPPTGIDEMTGEEFLAAWRDYNNSRPFREIYERLRPKRAMSKGHLKIHDMLLQNSADSPLIQAADFVSYAAYQHIRNVRGASRSPTNNEIDLYRTKLAASYRRILPSRWLPDDDQGVNWVGY
jgi:hypothetical protein